MNDYASSVVFLFAGIYFAPFWVRFLFMCYLIPRLFAIAKQFFPSVFVCLTIVSLEFLFEFLGCSANIIYFLFLVIKIFPKFPDVCYLVKSNLFMLVCIWLFLVAGGGNPHLYPFWDETLTQTDIHTYGCKRYSSHNPIHI